LFSIAFGEQYYLILESKKEIEKFIFAKNFYFLGKEIAIYSYGASSKKKMKTGDIDKFLDG
jgi:hypothetical protein